MKPNEDPGINTRDMPCTVKGRTVQWAHEGGKMGWSVPRSTQDFFTDIRKPFIRSTPLVVLDECPRKFLYVFKLGITPRSYSTPLFMGSIVHKVLQCLFLGQTTEEAQAAAQSLLSKEQQKLIKSTNNIGFLPSGKPLEAVLRQLEEDYHKARAMALVFWSMVPFEPGKYEVLRTPDGDPVVEMIIQDRYKGLTRPARTPCDLALLEKGTDNVWIVDFKTTSFDPRVQAVSTKLSPQLALYRLGLQGRLDAWADKGLAPVRKVVGSIHAFIRKPTIKYCPNTKDKGGFHTYVERLVEWYKEVEGKDPRNPPLLLDPNRFNRPTLTREFYGRLKQYCKACHASPNAAHFYRVGGTACLKFNKPCPYTILCNSDPVMWPDLIREKFTLGFREDEEDTDGV